MTTAKWLRKGQKGDSCQWNSFYGCARRGKCNFSACARTTCCYLWGSFKIH